MIAVVLFIVLNDATRILMVHDFQILDFHIVIKMLLSLHAVVITFKGVGKKS